MKKFSKVLALVLCFAMIACFAACGETDKTGGTTAADATKAALEANDSAEPEVTEQRETCMPSS